MAPDPQLVDRIREREWFHTIDLGDGLVTPGHPPHPLLASPEAFPDFEGRSVLDIGAWDGKYSFEAERAGARRVVALDHYIWLLDPAKRDAYFRACEAEDRLPDLDVVERGFLDATWLPGRQGFDLAKEYLGSTVEPVIGDFATMDLSELGRFDVVLYLGVLYHMVNPLGALGRVLEVTGEVAVIETAAVMVPGHEESALVAFYPGAELRGDYTNWFAPSETALHGMCRAVGFTRVETRARSAGAVAPPRKRRERPQPQAPETYRIVIHAYR
jgi:tRNA (mo5U34)-methyltransferase